jgi:hypothetical protein
MDTTKLLELLSAFVASWQFNTLIGLVVLDLALGIAAALKLGVFEWQKLADFYRTMVVPYSIGYLALYLVVNYVIPAGQVGEIANEAGVTVAWATLLTSLVSKIKTNLEVLYKPAD